MPGKIIIVPHHLYGKYEALEEVEFITPAGNKELRWKCRNTETDELSYQRPRTLKARNQDLLLDDVVNQLLIKKNIHQAGLRKAIFVEYRTNARSRKHAFDLSFEEFNELISKPCVYCGTEPNIKNGGHLEGRKRLDQPDLYTMGIDRIDSSKGYTKDNCVSCCSMCNIMKNTYSVSAFLGHIKKIYNYSFNEGSTTIPQGSTSQANGDGSGTPQLMLGDDIV